ncbi:MAG: hypothetical protein VKK04_00170 [Synechococcales bacterium]|nr:hypothetical protein [Synechococcales bacterium]
MDAASTFQPSQILCLEHQPGFLYAELIQAVVQRGAVWVRPLALKIPKSGAATAASCLLGVDLETSDLYDLRRSSDLLWPSVLFREALDTEVIPLLAHLGNQKYNPQSDRQAHEQLRRFIHQVWQDNAAVFHD